MAKKSKKKNPTRRRRRSVGAMALNAKSPLVMYGSMALGYLMSSTIEGFIPDTFMSTNTSRDKIIGAGTAGIGAALMLAKLGKKPKSVVEVAAGGVLIGAGAKKLLQAFGVISGIGGYQSVPVIGNKIRKGMSGYQNVPVIGMNGSAVGYTPNRVALNGVPSMNSGYTTRSTGNQIMGCVGDEAGASGYNPHN